MHQAGLSDRPYANSNLFSNHYLAERVDDRDEWDCDDDAQAAFERLRSLYDLEGDLVASYGEDELVDKWIDEVLAVLGFGTTVETTLPERDGYVDVLLFDGSETRRTAAEIYRESDETVDLFDRAVGIVEAKRWGADFSATFDERRPYRNASHQIKHYLERTPPSIQWGILTNGRTWRLYGTDDYETRTYYEVDLPALLETGSLEEFKYFYAFFRSAAFQGPTGRTFLDAVHAESETAAQELGADLQDNVFTALRVLGRGFVETNALDIDPDDEAGLEKLKEESLVLLYRLLFVCYAESRGLIHPDGAAASAEYEENFSLDALRLEIYETVGAAGTGFDAFSDHSTTMWSRLEDLFRLIDEGEESLGIPPYNGGLFDRERHAFLTDHAVSNRYLAEVVYRISTTETDEGRYVLADYADLDTRHLGSVYEGLLEHQFRIAPEQYAAVTADGGEVWKPATEVSVADAVEQVEQGALYVVNDQGERKATGAYYTPDYVVTYIVEGTIDPLLAAVHADLESRGLERGTRAYLEAFYGQVLDLTVLDPAMGSGHFLTTATEYLARAVIAEVRECDETTEYDERQVRRDVAKECIYGVDVNGMAVELAKLSMWLETLAADQPLAFLDHHLKTGNSLVGSDVTAVLDNGNGDGATGDGQLTLQQSFARVRERTLDHVMDRMQELLEIDNETLADVKSMEEIYEGVRSDPFYQRLFELTNVHTAERFDLEVPEGAYERMAQAIDDDAAWAAVSDESWFEAAQTMARAERVFHWELEYPEVFFDADGERLDDAGFDAVIGNPPYVSSRNETFSEATRSYVDDAYDLAVYQVDLYSLFTERSADLIRDGGWWSFIVPDSWVGDVTGEQFRRWLTSENVPVTLGLPVEPVFDADVDCIVVVATTDEETATSTRETATNDGPLKTHVWELEATGNEFSREIRLNEAGNPFVVSDAGQLVETVESDAVALSEVAMTGRGIGPYHHSVHDEETIENRAYHATERVDETYRPELAGKDIDTYERSWDGDRWISYGDWLAEPRDPALFEGPRVLCRKILADRLCCTYVGDDWLVDQQVYVASNFEEPYDPRYATAILASSLLGYYTRRKFHEDTDLFPHIRVAQFRDLPILDLEWDAESTLDRESFDPLVEQYRSGALDRADVLAELRTDLEARTPVVQSVLCSLVDDVIEATEQRQALNCSLLDHLGSYSDGPTLADVGFVQPPEGAADSPLTDTATDREKLRVGSCAVVRDSPSSLEIRLAARYKPEDENEDGNETDRWGYTETDLLPALRLSDLEERQADLLEAFVPVAVDEAGGFADFRETATKTNSLVDRLRNLTLPAVDDVEDGLESYLETMKRAEELEETIAKTDDLIDQIVYELYGLTDEEIAIVEEAAGE